MDEMLVMRDVNERLLYRPEVETKQPLMRTLRVFGVRNHLEPTRRFSL